jgi:hypothetical protein
MKVSAQFRPPPVMRQALAEIKPLVNARRMLRELARSARRVTRNAAGPSWFFLEESVAPGTRNAFASGE